VPRQIITSPKVITPRRAFSNGVRVGQTLYVAGQLPIDLDGHVVGAGDVRAQTRQVLENVRAIVEAAGGALRDVIKTTVYLTDIAHHGAMNEVYALFFVSEFPARTTVQVAGLAPALTGDGHPFLVEIDAVAILPPHMETTSWQP
jgi:2-iminobutanoate/2-iminopropanoate deaminase